MKNEKLGTDEIEKTVREDVDQNKIDYNKPFIGSDTGEDITN